MLQPVSREDLLATGLDETQAGALLPDVNRLLTSTTPPERCWRELSQTILSPDAPFALHQLLYEKTYAEWDPEQGPPPAWFPTEQEIQSTNLWELMQRLGLGSYKELFAWSVEHWAEFWRHLTDRLGIRFHVACASIADLSNLETPRWLVDAKVNIAASSFGADEDSPAIVHQGEGTALETMSYAELHALTKNRVANGLGVLWWTLYGRDRTCWSVDYL